MHFFFSIKLLSSSPRQHPVYTTQFSSRWITLSSIPQPFGLKISTNPDSESKMDCEGNFMYAYQQTVAGNRMLITQSYSACLCFKCRVTLEVGGIRRF